MTLMTEAQKRAISTYRCTHREKINEKDRENWSSRYAQNSEKLKTQSREAYLRRKKEKNRKDLGNYYFRKQWNILRNIDIF